MSALTMEKIKAMLQDLGPQAPGHPLARITRWRVSKDMYDQVKSACVEFYKEGGGREFKGLCHVEIQVAPLMLPGMAFGMAPNGEILMVIGAPK